MTLLNIITKKSETNFFKSKDYLFCSFRVSDICLILVSEVKNSYDVSHIIIRAYF